MSVTKRIRKIVNWLIFKEVASNDKELADLLGYTKSSFSQIVSGKTPISEKFIQKLSSLDENINKVWISTGQGEMFLNSIPNSENSSTLAQQVKPTVIEATMTIPASVWNVIQQQAQSLSARDRQIDEMLQMLKKEIGEKGLANARTEEPATSAVVG